jgi:hypothetical protein
LCSFGINLESSFDCGVFVLSSFFASPLVLLAGHLDPGFIFFWVAVMGLGGFVTFLTEAKKRQRQEQWRGIAKQLNGTYDPDSPTSTTGEISIRTQGTLILVDTFTDHKGTGGTATRVSTSMHGAHDFMLHLSLEGVMAGIGKALGTQDIILGDQSFDNKFVVKSNDEVLCRLWLNAMIRPMLLLLDTHTLSIEKGRIQLSKAGLEPELPELKRAVEVCAKLGKQTPKLSENWLGISKKFDGRFKNVKGNNPLPHNTQIELDYHGCRYIIEVITNQDKGLLTKITAEKPSSFGPFSIAPTNQPMSENTNELSLPHMPKQYRVFANNKEDATRTISEAATQAIQKIMPYAISSTQNSLEILLPGFVYAPETIKAALDLATTFVSQSQGPYR